MGFSGGSDGKESTCNVGDLGSIPGLGRSPGGGQGNPFQYCCLENLHWQRSLAGYSPWGPKESDTTERLTLVTTMSGNTQICLATWPCHKYFPINILPSSQNCSPYSPPMVYVFKAKWFKNKKWCSLKMFSQDREQSLTSRANVMTKWEFNKLG